MTFMLLIAPCSCANWEHNGDHSLSSELISSSSQLLITSPRAFLGRCNVASIIQLFIGRLLTVIDIIISTLTRDLRFLHYLHLNVKRANVKTALLYSK